MIRPETRKTRFSGIARCGSATPLALVAVIILFAISTALLNMGLQTRLQAIRTTTRLAARCAADAGLTTAMAAMNTALASSTLGTASLPQAINQSIPKFDATFAYSVLADKAGTYKIVSTGKIGDTTKTVTCTLRLQSPFEYAIHANANIIMKNGGLIDWYNYGKDSGKPKVVTSAIKDGSIELKKNAKIDGDVIVGFGGDPKEVVDNNGGTITGQTSAQIMPTTIPPVVLPASAASLPYCGSLQKSTTITTSGKYSKIDLKKDADITIKNDVTLYVTGDLVLGNSANITIAKGASLTLYVEGKIDGKNSSSFNNESKNPKQLSIYGLDSCKKIDLKNSTEFYGTIYAPDADVTFHNSADAYGAIVANSMEQKNSAAFHYDASLRESDAAPEIARFVSQNWQEE